MLFFVVLERSRRGFATLFARADHTHTVVNPVALLGHSEQIEFSFYTFDDLGRLSVDQNSAPIPEIVFIHSPVYLLIHT